MPLHCSQVLITLETYLEQWNLYDGVSLRKLKDEHI